MEYSNIFVCLMGIGTVFVGLICIIIICTLMGAVSKALFKEEPKKNDNTPVLSNDVSEIPNRQEMIAAVSAAIAEELGKDVSAIRILSVKKL